MEFLIKYNSEKLNSKPQHSMIEFLSLAPFNFQNKLSKSEKGPFPVLHHANDLVCFKFIDKGESLLPFKKWI